jgi:hypothetical protein
VTRRRKVATTQKGQVGLVRFRHKGRRKCSYSCAGGVQHDNMAVATRFLLYSPPYVGDMPATSQITLYLARAHKAAAKNGKTASMMDALSTTSEMASRAHKTLGPQQQAGELGTRPGKMRGGQPLNPSVGDQSFWRASHGPGPFSVPSMRTNSFFPALWLSIQCRSWRARSVRHLFEAWWFRRGCHHRHQSIQEGDKNVDQLEQNDPENEKRARTDADPTQ